MNPKDIRLSPDPDMAGSYAACNVQGELLRIWLFEPIQRLLPWLMGMLSGLRLKKSSSAVKLQGTQANQQESDRLVRPAHNGIMWPNEQVFWSDTIVWDIQNS